MSTVFETKPRWPGAPPICVATNCLAHKTEKEMKSWLERNCPSVRILKTWLCKKCKHWHHVGVGYGPSGSSSGSDRSAKVTLDTMHTWARDL